MTSGETQSIKTRGAHVWTDKTITEQFKSVDTTTSEVQKAFSKFVKDELGEEHPFDYKVVDGLVQKFGYVNAVLDKYTDYIVGRGMYIETEDEGLEADLDTWIDKTCLRMFLRPMVKEALAKGPGYLEIAGLSDSSKENMIKTVVPNTVFIKRDKYGEIEKINQYIGDSTTRISKEDIIPLPKDDIVIFNVNKMGGCGYGYGIVYSALTTVDNFLMAQKAIHQLTERKANVPIHAKIGNAEKDDYPSQEDIDAFGNNLTYLNHMTEWVTGPNVDLKVIDFGNIGDKFTEVLTNDYKLLSYCFQIPETIMGAGNVPEGLAQVQEDGFERRISSLQDDLAYVLRYQVFNKVLENLGWDVEEVKYQIVWGQPSEDDINKKLDVYKNILSVANISPGLQKAIESKIAVELDIDIKEVDKENVKAKKEQAAQMKAELQARKPFTKEMLTLQENLKGKYKDVEHIHENLEENTKISKLLNINLKPYKEDIMNAIDEDTFEDLRAVNAGEKKRGYLTREQVDELKVILKKGIEDNVTIEKLTNDILKKVELKDLKKYNEVIMDREERANMIARTEVARVINKGISNKYEKDGTLLVRWDATLDENICPLCAELNNKVFDFNSMTQEPPLHPNCRCNITNLKTTETADIGKILEDTKMAPQELETVLAKSLNITEEKAKKLVTSYIRIQDTVVDNVIK